MKYTNVISAWCTCLLICVGCSEQSSSVSDASEFQTIGTDTSEQSTDSATNPGDGDNGTETTIGAGNDTNVVGWGDDTTGTVEIAEGGTLLSDGDGVEFVCYEARCDGRVLECGDCKDNDGDGVTDWRDRECLGPCDNTEGPALISNVGGVTGSTCHVDCYFDYGNGMGSGSDDCWWSHECDPLEPEVQICQYDEKLVDNPKFCPQTQSQKCTDICMPFTPNGCDCFGCCTFPQLTGLAAGGSDAYVWIGAKGDDNQGTCTFDGILDENLCPRCTPVSNCLNPCDECEICIGKETIPASCYGTDTDNEDTDTPPPSGQCPDGISPCNMTDISPCDAGYYCISGCCQLLTQVEQIFR